MVGTRREHAREARQVEAVAAKAEAEAAKALALGVLREKHQALALGQARGRTSFRGRCALALRDIGRQPAPS